MRKDLLTCAISVKEMTGNEIMLRFQLGFNIYEISLVIDSPIHQGNYRHIISVQLRPWSGYRKCYMFGTKVTKRYFAWKIKDFLSHV